MTRRKTTESDRREIVRMWDRGEATLHEIAAETGWAETTVSRAITRHLKRSDERTIITIKPEEG